MTYSNAQRWLGLYFLIITSCLGVYFLIFAETVALPVSREEAQHAFQVVIPVFLGQLTIIFQWLGSRDSGPSNELVPIPTWAIIAPPITAVFIVASVVAAVAIKNLISQTGAGGLDTGVFNTPVTFAVGIINASTVFLVARLFPHKPAPAAEHGDKASS